MLCSLNAFVMHYTVVVANTAPVELCKSEYCIKLTAATIHVFNYYYQVLKYTLNPQS